METVMSCVSLVSEIVGRLKRQRDLAMCSMVSRVWYDCCRISKGTITRGHSYVVMLDLERPLIWTLNLLTGEQHRQRYPGSDSPHYATLLATRDGLVVMRYSEINGVCHILVGEPSVGKWKALPKSDFYVVAAHLVEENQKIKLYTVLENGRVDEYNFEERRWEERNPGVNTFRFFSSFCNYQGGFIAFSSYGGSAYEYREQIFLYNIKNREWSRVDEGYDACFTSWNDRVLLARSNLLELVLEKSISDDTYRITTVEPQWLLKAINEHPSSAGIIKRGCLTLLSGSGEHLFFTGTEMDVLVKLSFDLKNMSTTAVDSVDLAGLEAGIPSYMKRFYHDQRFCFTSDGGEVMSQIDALSHETKTRKRYKRKH